MRWGAAAISLALASPQIGHGDGHVLVAPGRPHRLHRVPHGPSAGGRRAAPAGAIGPGSSWRPGRGVSSRPPASAPRRSSSPCSPRRPWPGSPAGSASASGSPCSPSSAVLVPWLVHGEDHHDDFRRSAQGGGEIVLVALVAAYARRISGEADERRMMALDRLGRLSDANVLLFQLHQVTQTLPASLDLTEVLDVTMDQLRELFDADGVAILVHEDTDGSWATVRRHGLQAASGFGSGELPAALSRAVAVRSTDREDDLSHLRSRPGPGLPVGPLRRPDRPGTPPSASSPSSTATTHHFTDRDVELLTGFVDPAALAIDNARWFGRLRTARRRRGAHPDRPRPPRPHRAVARLPRLRARPHHQAGRQGGRGGRRPSTPCGVTSARSSASCGTPSTTCAPT